MYSPDHLSASQIIKFLMCPLSYKFAYVDRIETGTKSSSFALGTAFHTAAEQLHKHMMNGGVRAPKVYHDALGDSLKIECGNFDVQMKEDETPDSLITEGNRLMDAYREYRISQPAKLLAAEQRIERELVNPATGEILDVPFVAFLDLVEQNGHAIIVVDLKTAGRSYSQQDADTNLQLTCYGLLILLETGKAPSGLRIDAIIRTKTPKVQSLATSRAETDYVRFFALARAVRAAIEGGHFYPNLGWSCPTCEFGEHCRRWGVKNGKENT